MNAPTVAIAVSNTMFASPIIAAPPKIVPLDTSSLLDVLFSRSPTLLLSLAHTPMPPRTRYRNATAIIQTKNSATDSTSDTLSTLHGSTRRICMLARTGPLVGGRTCIRFVRADDTGSPPGRSGAGLFRGGRGTAVDRSGSSLRIPSFRTGASVRAGGGTSGRAGGGTSGRAGGGAGASGWGACGFAAAGPEMKRLIRSSTPDGAWGPGGGSGRRAGGGCCDRPVAPRGKGGTSPRSVTGPGFDSPGFACPGFACPGFDRGADPLDRGPGGGGPLPLPGSFGELTSAPYVVEYGSASTAPSVLTPSSAFRAMATSVSPSPRFINRTPLVWRPALRTCRAAVRITPPPEVIAYNSVSSSTICAPTSVPRRRSY